MTDLRSAVRYARTPTTVTLTILAAALGVLRIALGRFDYRDALAIGATLVAYPFVEWAAHRFVLHSGEFRLFGSTRRLGVARNHEAHHRAPADATKVASETGRNLIMAIAGATVPFAVVFQTVRPTLTGAITVVLGLLIYEITHTLIHSSHRGRSPRFRAVRRRHILHHYRNEGRWFGVAVGTADRLLGTNPLPDEVEITPLAQIARRSPASAAATAEATAGEASTAES